MIVYYKVILKIWNNIDYHVWENELGTSNDTDHNVTTKKTFFFLITNFSVHKGKYKGGSNETIGHV